MYNMKTMLMKLFTILIEKIKFVHRPQNFKSLVKSKVQNISLLFILYKCISCKYEFC